MLSFDNFNYKTNINRNNINNVFSKQGKQFKRTIEEKVPNNDSDSDSYLLNNPNSKKQHFFKEGFDNLENNTSLFDNKTFKYPSIDYINYYKDQSEKETQNTNQLLQQANNMNYQQSQNVFQNNLNSNVYVNTLTNDNLSSKFINLYQDNSTNPLMTILDGNYTYDSCSKTASLLGMNYFGLEQTNTSTNTGVCSVGSNVDINSFPVFQEKCYQSTDGYTYGGGWANAIYQFEDGQPSYIGCYGDEPNRAMIPTGDLSYYNPVWLAGSYSEPPWNLTTSYIDPTAQWIWYTEEASENAPVNPTPVLILGVYNNSSNSYQYANIYGCCDNSCTIVINSSNVDISGNIMGISGGWGGNGDTGMQVQFNPGANYIEAYVINAGGPAGLLLSFIDQTNNATVFCNTNINGNQNMGAWYYSLISPKYNAPWTQSYSVQTCADYAKLFNYNYFGLQNIQDNTPGTAQCFVSNDLSNSEVYGLLGGSVEHNKKTYGLGYTNAIYNLDFSGNPSNMGLVGYVNELNQLSEYPSSMISYGTSETYSILPHYDSSGNNIQIYNDVTLEQCMSYSNSNSSSYGFSYDTSQNICYLKNQNMYSPYSMNPNNELYSPPPLQPQDNFLLYMKQPTIINENSSCPTQLETISSNEWSNYTNTGVDMSSTTLCKLQKANNEILQTRQN